MSSDSPESAARIRIRRRVEWMDTDAAGIHHSSTVIRFAEAAEAEPHSAQGDLTSLFIDTQTGRSRPWPDTVRAALTGGGQRQPEA
jgi:acyl-CoA thioesterase FadM